LNTAFWIARRYFKSRKKTSFISIISTIAMLGVGVGTMALVIVLSVFNGMEDLHRQLFRSFDAELKITPTRGKRFTVSADTLLKIKALSGVKSLTQVVEDNALAVYGDRRMVVKIKGVSDDFLAHNQLQKAIIEGQMALKADGAPLATIGVSVYDAMGISLKNIFLPLELWYPRRGRSLTVPSLDAFNQQIIRPTAVFALDVRYDTYVITPLTFARSLLGYEQELSSIEIGIKPDAMPEKVQNLLQNLLGQHYTVRTRDEQNADLLRAIRIEKLFVAVTLGLIILVAAVNIFFSLSMLVLEKKTDIAMLRAMGATPQFIKRVFLFEGGLVAIVGAAVGLVLGIIICWLQQTYGLVSLGVANSVVEAYPVKMIATDLIITVLIVVLVAFIISYFPANKAARVTA
jgi:lipoprotein-releasing system permease protein